jgi:hypothetical protein
MALMLNLLVKCSRTYAGERAEAVLRDMHEHGVAAIKVNYYIVILAHARSKKALAFDQVEALLQEMEK